MNHVLGRSAGASSCSSSLLMWMSPIPASSNESAILLLLLISYLAFTVAVTPAPAQMLWMSSLYLRNKLCKSFRPDIKHQDSGRCSVVATSLHISSKQGSPQNFNLVKGLEKFVSILKSFALNSHPEVTSLSFLLITNSGRTESDWAACLTLF